MIGYYPKLSAYISIGVCEVTPVSLALIDNCPIMLEGVAAHLSRSNRFNIVAQGASADDALSIFEGHSPDLMIIDLAIPGNAFQAIANITAKRKATKVVIFTTVTNLDYAIRALDAGATGYVLKSSTVEELTNAMNAVERGATYITESLSGKIINALRNRSLHRMEAQVKRLSVREEQIVRQLLQGRTNKEIAAKLLISEKTVKHYMTVLMQKLNARNRLEVALAAQQLDNAIVKPGTGHDGSYLN